ncbi:membrane protein [Gordonia phage Catfish]|uniref:Holin n=1 Tax=Gordonia phage Catfish TaxID=2301538 RepID=A0A385D1R1_9CAUD|nr:membrane protein [Gordonia phage Catfish]AXQ51861.1 hypothetical protein SEA_CATFISH_24 [Gordonia phage Catfish]
MATLKDQAADAGTRAVKTFFQSLGASLVMVTGVAGLDWKYALSTAAIAAAWSFSENMGRGGDGPRPTVATTVQFAAPYQRGA